MRRRNSLIRLLLWASIGASLVGCQSFQKKTVQKSAQCEALCTQAREARELGDSDRANRCINEALKQKPSDFESRRQLAEVMWQSGRREEAISQYTSLCEHRPKDAKIWARLAVMKWNANQHSAAAKTAIAALQLDPQSKDAWQIKARNEVAEGKLEDALASYIRLSQVAPDDPLVLVESGELHMKQGHPDRACPLFRKAVQHPQQTEAQRAEFEWMIGVAYARSERWSVAVDCLERANAHRNPSTDDLCFLGWIRLRSGDLVGAQSDLQHALHSNPESVAVRKFAKQLEAAADTAKADEWVTPAGFQEKKLTSRQLD